MFLKTILQQIMFLFSIRVITRLILYSVIIGLVFYIVSQKTGKDVGSMLKGLQKTTDAVYSKINEGTKVLEKSSK